MRLQHSRDRVGYLAAGKVGEHRDGRLRVKAFEMECGEHKLGGLVGFVAHGDDDSHALGREPPRGEYDGVHGRAVEPLGIVYGDEQGRVRGGLGE